MSNTSQGLWHDNPNAPKTLSQTYNNERANFAGMYICAMLYGVIVILFLQCIGALLDPINRKRGSIKWLLVAHTVAIFLFVTVFTAMNLNFLSISYVDNREFGSADKFPGPLGYQRAADSTMRGVVSTVMFLLNNWLVNGLLLYRCYVIYAMNPWVIFFPSLMYLATVATGIVLVYYQISEPDCTIWSSTTINVGIPSSISVSLDVLLTLMIIVRLVLISREIQNAMNGPFRLTGLYKATITILCESSAFYAIIFVLWITTWAAGNSAEYIFFPTLAHAQVLASFLITIRVANRRAMRGGVTHEGIVSNPFSHGQLMDSSDTTPSDGHSASSTGMDGKTPGESGVKVVTTRSEGSFEI